VVVPPRVDQADLAQPARVHDPLGLQKQIEAAPLGADLQDATRASHRLDHAKAFFDGVGHGLLDIDVLACFYGVNGHAGVPVIRGGDDDDVQRLVFQHAPVIAKGLRSRGGDFQSRFEVGLVDVTDGCDLNADFLELRRQQTPAASGADQSRAHSLVGALHPAQRSCCGGQKRPALHSASSISKPPAGFGPLYNGDE
jgi:hypothetical protein